MVENLYEFKKITFKLFSRFCVTKLQPMNKLFYNDFFRIVPLIRLVDFWLKTWYRLVNRRTNMISEYFWITIVDWLKIKMYDWILLREISIHLSVFTRAILKGGGGSQSSINFMKKALIKILRTIFTTPWTFSMILLSISCVKSS